jgi:hypothetical protein
MNEALPAVIGCLLSCDARTRTKRAAERVIAARDKVAEIEANGGNSATIRAALAIYEGELAFQCDILQRLLDQANALCRGEPASH